MSKINLRICVFFRFFGTTVCVLWAAQPSVKIWHTRAVSAQLARKLIGLDKSECKRILICGWRAFSRARAPSRFHVNFVRCTATMNPLYPRSIYTTHFNILLFLIVFNVSRVTYARACELGWGFPHLKWNQILVGLNIIIYLHK